MATAGSLCYIDAYDWMNIANSPNCPPACIGVPIAGSILGTDARAARSTPAHVARLRSHRSGSQADEAAGSDGQDRASANDVVALSVRYVHKQIDRAIEDIQTARVDATGSEITSLVTPVKGLPLTHSRIRLSPSRRRFATTTASSSLRRSGSPTARSCAAATVEPPVWRLLGSVAVGPERAHQPERRPPVDYPIVMFQDGGIPALGPLATDRPHQLKAQFIYQFTFGTSIGLNQFVAGGVPVTRKVGTSAPTTSR